MFKSGQSTARVLIACWHNHAYDVDGLCGISSVPCTFGWPERLIRARDEMWMSA